MGDSGTLINLGDISKPATVLIEKISDAVGGVFRPYQIRRVAEAEAEAARIRALSEIEITDLHLRATSRFFSEEAQKQLNIESITKKALPNVDDDARPEEVEADWITDFFDRCRLVSDEEMQQLWAEILASQANNPGSISKRTLSLAASLDKEDAIMFTKFCSFVWELEEPTALVYEHSSGEFAEHGITFDTLHHFGNLGFLTLEPTGFFRTELPQEITASYFGKSVQVRFAGRENNMLIIGEVLFTAAGQQLAPLCGASPIPEFFDSVLERWRLANGIEAVVESGDEEDGTEST